MGKEYSNMKMAWHYLRDGGLPAAPKQVEVILSDLCNQDCNFCAYRMSGYTSNEMFTAGAELSKYGTNNPKRFIPHDRALGLLEEFRRLGVQGLQFTGGGEPTVHPHHEDIFEAALERGFACALVSNGFRWSDRLMDRILPQFAWTRVSLDAGREDTYAKVRRTSGKAFWKVLRNVRRLRDNVDRLKSANLLGVGFVVTPDNYAEIIDGCYHARKAGAHYIRLSAMFSNDNERPYRGIYDSIKTLITEAKRLHEGPDFTIHDLFKDRLQDLRDKRPEYKTCAHQYYTTYLGGDLNIYRCCVLAYNKRGLVASVAEQPFDETWNSEERKKDFEQFDARGCERCQFNDKNRAVAYLIEEKPKHVEFP